MGDVGTLYGPGVVASCSAPIDEAATSPLKADDPTLDVDECVKTDEAPCKTMSPDESTQETKPGTDG